MALTLDERWVTADPAQMAEWFVDISRERLAMIYDDLDVLPAIPLTLVEGSQLLPELLPDGVKAVFLLSTAEFQAQAIGDRPFDLPMSDPARALWNRLHRDWLLAERIRRGAVERGLHVIEVDGSRDANRVAQDVESELPRIEPARDLATVRRWENAAVAHQLRLWLASGEGPAVVREYPFACECGRPGCCDTVELAVSRFDEIADSGEAVTAAHG
jgi:hypothetical protein